MHATFTLRRHRVSYLTVGIVSLVCLLSPVLLLQKITRILNNSIMTNAKAANLQTALNHKIQQYNNSLCIKLYACQ